MDKNIITFQANEQELINTTPEVFASDTVSYIEARFELGQNWSGFDSVRAIWSNGYERISTVLDSLGVCIVPTEVLSRRADVLMNLVGSISDNGELTDRLTTFPVIALRVTKKAMVEGTETAPITPSQFEQFASAVRQDADRAEAGASEAEGYRDEAEEWADRAEQASANAGYMFFYINDDGDLIYQRTPNTQVDFYLQDGDLYVEAI